MSSPLADLTQRSELIGALVHPDRLTRASGLPDGLNKALQRPGSRVRFRYMAWLTERLGLADLDGASYPVPRDNGAILRCAAMVGLTLALARHDGIFFKHEYAALQERFGEEALAFAVRHRADIANVTSAARLDGEIEAIRLVGGVWLAAWAEAERPLLETWILAAFPDFPDVTLPDLQALGRAAPMIAAAVQAAWGEGGQS